eukprot:1160719-Pelagomonas_calceolata.AAC.2
METRGARGSAISNARLGVLVRGHHFKGLKLLEVAESNARLGVLTVLACGHRMQPWGFRVLGSWKV